MDVLEKEAVGKAVLDILEQDYHGNLAAVVAMTVGISEKVPSQANNEIQNAVNHLARAYTSLDRPAANKELALAREHFERATRDCLKICIIDRRQTLDNIVTLIEDKYGTILRPARKRLKGIVIERDTILSLESRGESGITDRLFKLVTECNDLYEDFLDKYTIPGVVARQRSKLFLWFKHNVQGFLIGVGGSMVAALLYAKLHLPTH